MLICATLILLLLLLPPKTRSFPSKTHSPRYVLRFARSPRFFLFFLLVFFIQIKIQYFWEGWGTVARRNGIIVAGLRLWDWEYAFYARHLCSTHSLSLSLSHMPSFTPPSLHRHAYNIIISMTYHSSVCLKATPKTNKTKRMGMCVDRTECRSKSWKKNTLRWQKAQPECYPERSGAWRSECLAPAPPINKWIFSSILCILRAANTHSARE